MIEQISHYKILKKLGAGGMGEVYLAEDQKLSRRVALKVLPAGAAGERKMVNRFLQEARLAATLNHPHICTIFEIEEDGDTPFLAMELVEGDTLTEKIRAGSFDLLETLNIATQIADALEEAHLQNIIHRDIKSSNIIINRRGHVKILDFGLAKMISEEVSEQAVTRAKTEEGTLLGTVRYMSPEQALGQKLDGRTDLWSLGVLLYEMVAGEVPFKAATHAGVFDEILHKDPVPPGELAENIPEELEQIILKLLEKDADLRYQTASDLLADLKRLRRNLGDSFESSEAISFSSAEFRQSRALAKKRGAGRIALYAFLAVVLLSGIGAAIYQLMPEARANFSFADAKPTRVTSLGKVLDATVSADGKYIAYVLDEGENQSLWLKQTENGGTARIIPTAEVIFQGIQISPDGNWLYYNLWDKKNVGEIFRVPVLGGIPQKIIHDCMPGLTISPDNKRIVFIRAIDETQTSRLISATIEGVDEQVIYETIPNRVGLHAPAFAPDGKTLAVTGHFRDGEADFFKARIVEMAADGGGLSTIWEGREENVGFASAPQWLPDKSGLLISLANGEVTNQLWLINYPDGAQTPINTDLNSYDSLSITADGKSFVGVEREFTLSVWTLPVAVPERAERITEGKIEGVGVDWTPDNQIIYSSIASGRFNIWKMKADGSQKQQLTNDNWSNVYPCVFLKSEKILFGSNGKGLRLITNDGRELADTWKQNIEGKGYDCMRSENSVLYASDEDGLEGIAKFDPETGEKTLVLKMRVQQVQVSPDGQQVFYSFWDEENKRLASEVLDLATNQKKTIELPVSAINNTGNFSHYNFNWMPDSKGLAYVDQTNGVSNIRIYPVSGGKPRQLTDFKDNLILDFSFSHDGKQLAVARGASVSDVVIFRTNTGEK